MWIIDGLLSEMYFFSPLFEDANPPFLFYYCCIKSHAEMFGAFSFTYYYILQYGNSRSNNWRNNSNFYFLLYHWLK